MFMISPIAPPAWQQARELKERLAVATKEMQERLIAAAAEFHAALVVPLRHPETNKDLLPQMPLNEVIELSRIAIRRSHTDPKPALDRLNAATEELYAAIRAASQPREGSATHGWVPLRTSPRKVGMIELTGLKMFTLRQIIGTDTP